MSSVFDNFDWKDVAGVVAPMAPALGGLLGGLIPFPGGALAGQALGTLIAKQFGVPATPAAVGAAMAANPNEVVLAKLQAAMEEARAQWPALAEMEKAWAQTAQRTTESVNATMRVELEHEHWFFTGWRPAAGWLFVIFAGVCAVMLVLACLQAAAGKPGLLNAIKDVQVLAGSLLGALAATVGVYIIGRSKEKTAVIENMPTTAPAPAASETKIKKTGK